MSSGSLRLWKHKQSTKCGHRVLWVLSLISLQAACKPVTHIYVTVVCQSTLETHELFTQIGAHTRIPMSNQCAWPHEPWTWITSSGSTGRVQVKRNPKGLGTCIQRTHFGYKAKGVQQWHSRNVLIQLKEVFWQCNKRGSVATREDIGEGKSLILAWTLSAVPAWVWQMQQINPYLLPFGIKQNNPSKCWPGKLAVIVTFVEKPSWETECLHCTPLSIPKIISIVYSIAENLHMTAASCITLIMQYVTSTTMTYFHMLHLC